MKILDIYSVDYKYIDLLRTKWPSTILEHKREKSPMGGRKYFGPIMEKNGCKYYVPLSTKGKNKPIYYDENGIKKIKPDTTQETYIKRVSEDGSEYFYGALRFENMIPVPDFCVERYKIASLDKTSFQFLSFSATILDCNMSNLKAKNERKAKVLYNLITYKQPKNEVEERIIANVHNFEDVEKVCKQVTNEHIISVAKEEREKIIGQAYYCANDHDNRHIILTCDKATDKEIYFASKQDNKFSELNINIMKIKDDKIEHILCFVCDNEEEIQEKFDDQVKKIKTFETLKKKCISEKDLLLKACDVRIGEASEKSLEGIIYEDPDNKHFAYICNAALEKSKLNVFTIDLETNDMFFCKDFANGKVLQPNKELLGKVKNTAEITNNVIKPKQKALVKDKE